MTEINPRPVFDVNPTYDLELKEGINPEDILITLGFNITKGVSSDNKDTTYIHRKIPLKISEKEDRICSITLMLTDCPRVGKENYHLLENQLKDYGKIQPSSYR